MKGIRYILLWLLLGTVFLSGCKSSSGGSQEKNDGIVERSVVDSAYKVYYLNKDGIHIEGLPMIYTSETPEELIEELYLQP